MDLSLNFRAGDETCRGAAYGAPQYASRLGPLLRTARVKVIAQCHWETKDHKYKLADTDDETGVITAYCEGANKCPDALNRV